MIKPTINKVDLLDMALNIAAIRYASNYQIELWSSGKDCLYQISNQWIKERKEEWMREALHVLRNANPKA